MAWRDWCMQNVDHMFPQRTAQVVEPEAKSSHVAQHPEHARGLRVCLGWRVANTV